MNGSAAFFIGDEKVPVVIENPILSLDTTPLVPGDPSSFWILYQDWRYPSGTPYFRPFWPGNKGVLMNFDGNEPDKFVDLAVCSGKPTGRLDRVRVVDPTTGHPIEGIAPVGLMRGIPRQTPVPADLRYA